MDPQMMQQLLGQQQPQQAALPVPPRPMPQQGQPGGGGPGDAGKLLMAFMAGAGFDKIVSNVMKLKGGGQGGGDRKHVGGVRAEAAQTPGMTVAPQLAQQMAQGGQPQGLPPQITALLQAILRGRQGGAGMPA